MNNLIDAQTYNQLLDVLAPALAVAFWVVVRLLILEKRHNQQMPHITILWAAWAGHVALMWTCNAIYRLFFTYEGPTYLFSIWITILFVHAAVTFIWRWWVVTHFPTPIGLSIPQEWHDGDP